MITELVTRQQLVERWGDVCFYCGGEFEVVDHRIPVAAGGHHIVHNVVPSCSACNQRKRWSSDEQVIRNYRNLIGGDVRPVILTGAHPDRRAGQVRNLHVEEAATG
ncbi:hypothetical protein ASD37_25635 [Mycobacterium sp. Root135]|nr:hypothetical protein ASD37_25635 [Mycobacterium sp. Root135]